MYNQALLIDGTSAAAFEGRKTAVEHMISATFNTNKYGIVWSGMVWSGMVWSGQLFHLISTETIQSLSKEVYSKLMHLCRNRHHATSITHTRSFNDCIKWANVAVDIASHSELAEAYNTLGKTQVGK